MTIKNRGGVFGRNPTFNNVTVDGTLTAPNLTVGDDLIVTDAIGVGTSSPLSSVDIRTAEGGSPTNATFDNALRLTSTATAGVGVGPSILFRGETGNATTPYSFAGIHGVKSSAAGSNYSGDLIFSTQNSGGGTVLTEVARMLSTGGITFNGDTAAANALDDYEEGVYDATITTSTSGSVSLLSGQNSLQYTKIGRKVFVSGGLWVDTVSSPVGYFSISLPFVTASLSEAQGYFTGSVYVQGASSANMADFVVFGVPGQSSVRIYLGDATGFQADSAEQIGNSSEIYVSLCYIAA